MTCLYFEQCSLLYGKEIYKNFAFISAVINFLCMLMFHVPGIMKLNYISIELSKKSNAQ